MKPKRIMLADDHEIILEGLRVLVEKKANLELVGEAKDGRSAVRMARELRPDVVVMDVSLPELNGIEATSQLVGENPDIKVIALSMHSEQRFVSAMLKAGASAYLTKNNAFRELSNAIDAVLAGKNYFCPEIAQTMVQDYLHMSGGKDKKIQSDLLTRRELEVLQLLAEGQTARNAASKLHISVKTVETHRRNMMEKLNLTNISELIRYAIREGIVKL